MSAFQTQGPPSNSVFFAGVRASRTASATISSGSLSPLPMNAADTFDTDGYHDPAGDDTKLVVPTGKGGYYLMVGEISYSTNSTGLRGCFIEKNSVGIYPANTTIPTAASAGVTVQAVAIYFLSDGDFVQLIGFQNSGSGIDITGSFSMALLGT